MVDFGAVFPLTKTARFFLFDQKNRAVDVL